MQFTSTPQLNAALALAKINFEPIIADETAAFSTKNGGRIEFDYADLSDIIPAVTEALSEQGLAIASQITPINDRLFLVSRLLHSSGESIESYYPLTNPDGDPKGFGASITYGRRYNTLCLLEINTVDDNESKRKRKEKAAIAMKAEFSRQQRNHTESKPKPAEKSVVSGVSDTSKTISEAQLKRFHAIASQNGWSNEGKDSLLFIYGYQSASHIHPQRYDALCQALENPDATITAHQFKTLTNASKDAGFTYEGLLTLMTEFGYSQGGEIRVVDYKRLLDKASDRNLAGFYNSREPVGANN